MHNICSILLSAHNNNAYFYLSKEFSNKKYLKSLIKFKKKSIFGFFANRAEFYQIFYLAKKFTEKIDFLFSKAPLRSAQNSFFALFIFCQLSAR